MYHNIYRSTTRTNHHHLPISIVEHSAFPFTILIPWANCPSSFANDLYQNLVSGPLIRCLYSWDIPEIWWVTSLASWVFWNCAVNAKSGMGFSCLLISSWNLDLPCPPLEVAQYAPLVAVQVLQGGYCLDLKGTYGPFRGLPLIIFYAIVPQKFQPARTKHFTSV